MHWDDLPPRSRLTRVRALVEGTPLDTVVKWAIVVYVTVEVAAVLMAAAQATWSTALGWVRWLF